MSVSLHFSAPSEVSPLNVIGRLEMGLDRIVPEKFVERADYRERTDPKRTLERADYKAVLTTNGTGPPRHAVLKSYPRWSANAWDLIIRMVCLCLHDRERIWPDSVDRCRTAPYIDHLTACIEERNLEGDTPVCVSSGVAHIEMQRRNCYKASFEDVTGTLSGQVFAFTPGLLDPWELLTRAYAWCSGGKFALPPRPRLYIPCTVKLGDIDVIPIDTLPQPARSAVSVWMIRSGLPVVESELIQGPCVTATQFADFLQKLPKPLPPPERPREDLQVSERRTTRSIRRKSARNSMNRGIPDISRWSKLRCVRHVATLRWGSFTHVICPHCGCGTAHYWSASELRWKCRHCDRRFSVTSGTVFANRRIPIRTMLNILHAWASADSGVAALTLKKTIGTHCYNTLFTFGGKLREGLVKGFNTGLLEGFIEIDGAHASGKRSKDKRGSPMRYPIAKKPFDSSMLTSSARSHKKRADKKAGKPVEVSLPPDRRIVMNIRLRSGQHNHGACKTRIGVWTSEHSDAIEALVDKFVVAPPSILCTDTGPAFSQVGAEFTRHDQVNHSETFVGPNGEHNNNAESYTTRLDRGEYGAHIHRGPKYLTDYAVEMAFREDHCELAAGARADCALRFALNIGLSEYWRGYGQGHHRDHELTALGTAPAKAAGFASKRSRAATTSWPKWSNRAY